jgi:hypothetical protein
MTEPGSEFWTALGAVQAEAPALPKDGTNPHFHSKFTTLAMVVEKIRPLLATHGLVWSTFPTQREGTLVLQCRLAHAETGQTLEGEMPLLLGKNDSQGFGSAITYARRYSLCAVLNLVADEDDDGKAASTPGASTSRLGSGKGFASEKQVQLIERELKLKGVTKPQLEILLAEIGADVEVAPGWIGRLSGGREGSASALISRLKEGALPDPEHPSDVPANDDGFEHPPEQPMELIQ